VLGRKGGWAPISNSLNKVSGGRHSHPKIASIGGSQGARKLYIRKISNFFQEMYTSFKVG